MPLGHRYATAQPAEGMSSLSLPEFVDGTRSEVDSVRFTSRQRIRHVTLGPQESGDPLTA